MITPSKRLETALQVITEMKHAMTVPELVAAFYREASIRMLRFRQRTIERVIREAIQECIAVGCVAIDEDGNVSPWA